MSYLLSSGRSTDSKLTYVKDLITLLMYLDPEDIPYTKDGSKSLIEAINSEEVESSVRAVVTNVLSTIKNKVPDVTIDVGAVTVLSNSVKVEVIINGSKSYYDIAR